MIKRTQEQWHNLFSAHEASEFCKQHGICPNYFSKRKKELLTKPKSVKSTVFMPVSHTASSTSQLELQHEQVQIKIPLTVQASWLAELIHRLQA